MNEIKVLKKLDFYLVPLLIFTYTFCLLERVNIGNARILNFEHGQGQMERDLQISSDTYNLSVSIFFIGYILFEIPSNLLLLKWTPRFWFSRIAISWGICACLMSAVQNGIELLLCRFILGLLEAGFAPGVVYYLGLWYKKFELSTRMGIFFSTIQVNVTHSFLN